MTRIIISGVSGHLGQAVLGLARNDKTVEVVAGLRRGAGGDYGFPVFRDALDCDIAADVLVDVSSADALSGLLRFAQLRRVPLVLCTTGYDADALDRIRECSRDVPILRSGNMSLGVNLLLELTRRSAVALGPDFDVEIVEKHHRRKVDAPSGTALMLAEAAAGSMWDKPDFVFERASRREPRRDGEIGVSSVRGGTIVGEHEVIFAGNDEVIELRHVAYSRDVFAVGAIRAAKHMAGVTASGLYDMQDVLADNR
ncbi:MAG: 4-hydroxy-tetrahydrodipicolinate reductase [Oscillospiraceae bacterium]|jgi:4-hydroxy-tetrahydrodipicolinate reductase|nr:4-hydroxy-tetrahydrodipicolinate reductase [Oscillospiraceae bacterium]